MKRRPTGLTGTESEREIAKDAPAGIAYVKSRGLADEGELLAALGLGGSA